ncbi:hypothetical protein RRG08_048425 [Elysia crispata]|uniref:Uncharacterized protein n=1 Tax=Elysia crispata TaxID=231223 RepID=A0AAE1EDC0_9GAST|nr:hypothetical protein RRG08_048425 [Elysia crispata]
MRHTECRGAAVEGWETVRAPCGPPTQYKHGCIAVGGSREPRAMILLNKRPQTWVPKVTVYTMMLFLNPHEKLLEVFCASQTPALHII